MVARRLILATAVSLSLLDVCVLFAAPVAVAEPCPNAASRQGPSVGLPDCRVYEQLTPVDKGDATDLFSRGTGETAENPDRGYASDSGNGFLLLTNQANFANGVSGKNTYVFSRGSDGWVTTPVAPAGLGVQSVLPAVFDPATGFAEVGVTDTIGSQTLTFGGDESARQVANLIGPAAGPFRTLSMEQFSLETPNTKMVGASADLSHVVLEGHNHELAPGDTGQDSESSALYESSDGHCGWSTSRAAGRWSARAARYSVRARLSKAARTTPCRATARRSSSPLPTRKGRARAAGNPKLVQRSILLSSTCAKRGQGLWTSRLPTQVSAIQTAYSLPSTWEHPPTGRTSSL